MSEHTPRFNHAGYHKVSMRPDRMKKLRPVIRKILAKYEFEAIAFRGLSGALLAMPIAMALNKSLIMVRKGEDNCHSKYLPVQGDLNTKRYVIIDDFKSSGNTVEIIRKAVKDFASEAECLGVLEVNHLWSEDEDGVYPVNVKTYELTPVEGPGVC
jgi:adenine/guanine phosphoribosyltransferase-like PRPP-binding protein